MAKSKYLTAIYDQLVKEWPGEPDEIRLDECTLDKVLDHITFLHDEYDCYKTEYESVHEALGELAEQEDDVTELWQLVLNLGSEFDVPATQRSDPTFVEVRGMIRTLEILAQKLRDARRSNSAA